MLIALTVKVLITLLENHGIQYTSSMGGIYFVWSSVLCVYKDMWSVSLFHKLQSLLVIIYYGVFLKIAIVHKGSEQSGFFFSIFKTK